jgi:hypothetical protein
MGITHLGTLPECASGSPSAWDGRRPKISRIENARIPPRYRTVRIARLRMPVREAGEHAPISASASARNSTSARNVRPLPCLRSLLSSPVSEALTTQRTTGGKDGGASGGWAEYRTACGEWRPARQVRLGRPPAPAVLAGAARGLAAGNNSDRREPSREIRS